jgi:hypothetical protein
MVYQKDPPQRETVAVWFKCFIEMGSVAHKEYGQGCPGLADDVVERMKHSYERSVRKSTVTLVKCD